MNNHNSQYPKLQYSAFLDNDKKEQFVIRADNFEEFKQLKREIDLVVKTKSSQMSEPNTHANRAMKCVMCGGDAELREGVSKKTQKSYKGVFCLDRQCDYAKFL